MDRADFERYRKHHLQVRRGSFYAVVGASLAIGFALSTLWSFIGGAAGAVLLIFAGMRLHMWWDKARRIRRFPELGDPVVKWRRTGW